MLGHNNFKLFALLLVAYLSACSPTQQAYQQNIRLYFESNEDVVLTNELVTNSEADLIYVKNGQRSIATMALAFIEDGRYKWLSRDNAMIITENGRLVRTLGFNENLIYVSNLNNDPIKSFSTGSAGQLSWDRVIDTEVGDVGARVASQITREDNILLSIQGFEFNTFKLKENIEYDSAVLGKHTWTNTFWFDSNTKQLLQSSQTIAPNMDKIDITYVSRALRLLDSQEREGT